jgi:DNA recombination protein RmuC
MELTYILLVCNLILMAAALAKLFFLGGESRALEAAVREELLRNRQELSGSLKNVGDSLSRQIIDMTRMNESKLENVRGVIDANLKSLQEDNSRKLEQMRQTVDEKLHETLERRLGESFATVSRQLKDVHEGLGDMKNLASGVGDLKKVLTNVKTRGIWGEIALGNLLEQILTPEQYEKNVVTKPGSRDPVEFAIKLPGKDNGAVYLPIDAKFPKEDYERLMQAQDSGDASAVEDAGKAMETRIKLEAKKIREKYIDPPHTTDFGVLFLPIEGLYAEALRRVGLSEFIQREYKITLTGPTTLAAMLNSLQMGFRTLAVEKRASDVWRLLGEVKKEFGKFGDLLEKTKLKIDQAGKELESASRKSRTIEGRLRKVESLPAPAEIQLVTGGPEDEPFLELSPDD